VLAIILREELEKHGDFSTCSTVRKAAARILRDNASEWEVVPLKPPVHATPPRAPAPIQLPSDEGEPAAVQGAHTPKRASLRRPPQPPQSCTSPRAELQERLSSARGGCGSLNTTFEYGEEGGGCGVGLLDEWWEQLDYVGYAALDDSAARLNPRMYLIWKLAGYCT
jgi:hypothetical protein